jgi:hypothetical protein
VGDKRPSIRTLPSGERCVHHPPSDEFPEGMLTLIRDCSPLRDRHEARLEEHRSRHADLKGEHHDRLRVKRGVQQAKGVPAEKRCV